MTGENEADSRQGGKSPRRTRLPAAERRETILRAAAAVFAEAGYRAAKVSDVAARVGVTEPVIFQNFASKAALFAAVIERAAAESRAWLAPQGPAAPGTAAAVLTAILTGSPPELRHGTQSEPQPGASGHPAGAAAALLAEAAALTADPELAGPARDAVRAVAGHLADLVRRAQADGDAAQDADADAAGWLLLSLLSARRLRAAAMPAGLEPDVAVLALRCLSQAP